MIDQDELNKVLTQWVKPIERLLDWKPAVWAWPVLLVILGGGAWGASLVFSPVSPTVVALWNTNLPEASCSFLQLTGWPCPFPSLPY